MALYVKFECDTCENENCTGHGLPTTEKICDGYKHTTTNADRIRSLSDEELAKFFTGYYDDGPKFWCPAQANIGEGECAKADDCRECFLNWLKQEAEEGE